MLVLDRTDTKGSPVGTPTTDRIDIRDSPVGMLTTDRIDILGSLAGISLDLDTIKGLPAGDSQDHALGLHLETEVDRGLPTDRSRNLLTGHNPLDTILIPGKVGNPTERTVQTRTAPCPQGTPTLS